MAKNTWVKTGGVWKEVKNVWEKVQGVWKQKVIPKGNIAGVWKEFMQYLLLLYKNGVEYQQIEMGWSNAGSTRRTFQKDATNIKFVINNDANRYLMAEV